jgi:L-2-hydroxyglutarate oxidase LhgO
VRIAIVGAGILGLALARELAVRHPDAELVVLEKEDAIATHQTGRNSGVVHAGIYYPPGSLKATLCRRGVALLRAFCEEHDLAWDACGKVVVATGDNELPRLRAIEEKARGNGVPVEMIGPERLRELEPHCVGVAALHSPTTAIVDYVAICRALRADLEARGGRVRLGVDVVRIEELAEGVRIHTAAGEELAADHVCVCAGLHADRLASASGEPREPRIVPFRGEYYALSPERVDLCRSLIYPVPDPALPFLGVHLTKTIDGGVLVGPNAVLALAREGYDWGTIRPGELAQLARWGGTWRLFRTYWRTGIDEVVRSWSRRRFVEEARRYVPELRVDDVVPADAGVRAQAVDADGSLVDDFRLGVTKHATWVRNAPSPAATASLAIAEHLADRIAF